VFFANQSISTPPSGYEKDMQNVVSDNLWGLGFEVSVADVPRDGLSRHPAFRSDRLLENRPNVVGVAPGSGGGRSLLLAGHVDTLAPDSKVWEDAKFFSDDNDMFVGLGINGGKGAVAGAIIALKALDNAGIKIKGDLHFASVVDETYLGLQGMLGFASEGVGAEGAVYMASPENVLCSCGSGEAYNTEELALFERWKCSSNDLVGVCQTVTDNCSASFCPDECKDSSGAFLLQNYAKVPTVIAGVPAEDSGTAEKVSLNGEDLLEYSRMLGYIIMSWCGVK
jgi:hypothetical protein